MKSLFEKENNTEIVVRFKKLNKNAQPLWGKMNVSQMVVHCQKPLDVVEGTLVLKRNIIGFLFGKMIKNKIIGGKTMPKNSPTDKAFIIKKDFEFEAEQSKLIEQIARFYSKGEGVIGNKKHPFFGTMTTEEWGILSYMHLDHHLKQFGV